MATTETRTYEKSETLQKSADALLVSHSTSRITDDSNFVRQPVLSKAKGAMVVDVDGNEYIDYACANGTVLLGHADERLVVAANKSLSKGRFLGSPTETEIRLAELISSRYSFVDLVQFRRNARNALVQAVRLAIGFTKRSRVLVIGDTCDAYGSYGADVNVESIESNDIETVQAAFAGDESSIAAMVVAPVATTTELTPPADGYLTLLRQLCNDQGALLIFDERSMGLRLGAGGAANMFGVSPDMFVLGGALGGGSPIAVLGGRRELMNLLCKESVLSFPKELPPDQPSFATAIATLQAVGEPDFYTSLNEKAARLNEGFKQAAADAGLRTRHVQIGSASALRFLDEGSGKGNATENRFHSLLVENGVMTSCESPTLMFVMAAHTDDQIDKTIEIAKLIFAQLAALDEN